MVRALRRGFDRGELTRLGACFGVVAALHVLGWGGLFIGGGGHAALLGLGGLAYTLGLRHAFDVDHIAAIDNTTRKLLHERQKPMAVGFFFSLGHSSVVLVVAVAIGLAVRALVTSMSNGSLLAIGSLIGTSVAGTFLIVIGLVNLVVLVGVARQYRRVRRGDYDEETLNEELAAGGLMTRIFGRLFGLIKKSWHMYLVGFLFGLGFDTASEVLFFGVSAAAAAQGSAFITLISFPVIFAAGMSLMDTTDGAFMAKAYGWAFSTPIRKVFYNLSVTALSVFVALFVGAVEVLNLLAQGLGLRGGVWGALRGLDFGTMGLVIVVAFVLTWLTAFVVFKVRRVEERWSAVVDERRQSRGSGRAA